jgi:2-oxoisovalerate dehydrogenase E1 component alpha subunit
LTLFHSQQGDHAMPTKSRLHIPKPHSRPGEEPDFSYLETSPAGAVARPDVNARVRDISHLSVELVRVLDDEHRAVGPWHPHLDAPELQVALRHMLLTRIFDERMQRAQRRNQCQEKMRTVVLGRVQ